MIYGLFLFQIMHYISALCRKYPNEKILISKYDFSDKYWQISNTASETVKKIMVCN